MHHTYSAHALILCYPENSRAGICISEKDTLTKFQSHICTLWPLGAMIVGITIHYALDYPEFKFWWQKGISLPPNLHTHPDWLFPWRTAAGVWH
jgi:hypothetical protein